MLARVNTPQIVLFRLAQGEIKSRQSAFDKSKLAHHQPDGEEANQN